jgi:hypothetical protein
MSMMNGTIIEKETGFFAMTVRERVLAVLRGQKADAVPWLGDLSYWIHYLESSGKMPDRYREDGMFQLHRDLGVGFYLQGYFPFKTKYEGVTFTNETTGNRLVSRIDTPVGTVREVYETLPESYTAARTEHLVKDVRDLKVIRYLYEHTFYEPDYELASRRYDLIGDNGVVLCYLPRSPFMDVAVALAGIQATTFAMLDDPDEFNETMEVMEKKSDEAALIALHSPAECLMIPENISSEVIGKRFFEAYMKSYEEKWNGEIKKAGKFSFVHMDGTMKGLIREVSSTGFRVMEALTPAPVGDLPIEEIRSWVQPDTVIWGGIPGLYFTDLVSDSDFDEFVKRILTVMRSEPRYVLGVADQVPPECRFERIKRVSELVQEFGGY